MENGLQANYWRKVIARTRGGINVLLWLEYSAVPLFAAGVCSGFLLYGARRLGIGGGAVMPGVLCLMLAAALVCLWRVRGRLFRDRDARAFLDESLGLDCALSAEREGRGGYPPVREVSSCWKWKSFVPFCWVLGGVVLLVAGSLLPLPAPAQVLQDKTSLPPALAQVESWLDEMEKMPGIDPLSLEALRNQFEENSGQEPEDMYSHAGLEAADALREQTEQSMKEFSSGLSRMESALSSANSSLTSGSESESAESLRFAFSSLEASAIRPGGELGRQLGELGKKGPGALSPEQREQLERALAENGEKMRGLCQGGMCPGGGLLASPDQNGEVQPQAAPGAGAPERGRADAPLSFSTETSRVDGGLEEELESRDYSRSLPGDSLGMELGRHEENREKADGASAQAARGAKGGDAVWADDLTPEEKEALKDVFNS